MASPKKRVNPLFVALAVVLVAVVAAVGVVFFQLHSKISALQTSASFTFRYEIAPNSPDKPPLLNILERVNASSGSVSGQYAPGKAAAFLLPAQRRRLRQDVPLHPGLYRLRRDALRHRAALHRSASGCHR